MRLKCRIALRTATPPRAYLPPSRLLCQRTSKLRVVTIDHALSGCCEHPRGTNLLQKAASAQRLKISRQIFWYAEDRYGTTRNHVQEADLVRRHGILSEHAA
jgi:hypothetical protein